MLTLFPMVGKACLTTAARSGQKLVDDNSQFQLNIARVGKIKGKTFTFPNVLFFS